MRVGIVTINDYNNYGNRLQNYATQEVLKSIECEPVTIVNSPHKRRNIFERVKRLSFRGLIRLGLSLLKRIRYKLYRNSKKREYIALKEKRIGAFREFTNKNIIETNYTITQDNIPDNLGEQYDAFIVGSDQVWNPNFRGGSSIDFLTFAPRNKRISYAASFGVSTLPDEYVKNYGSWLSQMEHISVREEAGASIVYELTGREIKVLVDPTLMLDKNMWLSIGKTSKGKPNNPYILTYFLGEISQEIEAFINKIKEEYNLEAVHLVDINDPVRYVAGPGEFLDYINLSEIFLTDSFHGAIFSILFEKPFVICDRISKTPSMGSRIETLLTKFKLEDRKWENIKDSDNPFDIDFSHISPILELERKKSLNYLKNALDIKDEN